MPDLCACSPRQCLAGMWRGRRFGPPQGYPHFQPFSVWRIVQLPAGLLHIQRPAPQSRWLSACTGWQALAPFPVRDPYDGLKSPQRMVARFLGGGIPNRYRLAHDAQFLQMKTLSVHYLGRAAGNLLAEATACGLSVHQMIGILPDKARSLSDTAAFRGVDLISPGPNNSRSSFPDS